MFVCVSSFRSLFLFKTLGLSSLVPLASSRSSSPLNLLKVSTRIYVYLLSVLYS